MNPINDTTKPARRVNSEYRFLVHRLIISPTHRIAGREDLYFSKSDRDACAVWMGFMEDDDDDDAWYGFSEDRILSTREDGSNVCEHREDLISRREKKRLQAQLRALRNQQHKSRHRKTPSSLTVYFSEMEFGSGLCPTPLFTSLYGFASANPSSRR